MNNPFDWLIAVDFADSNVKYLLHHCVHPYLPFYLKPLAADPVAPLGPLPVPENFTQRQFANIEIQFSVLWSFNLILIGCILLASLSWLPSFFR